MQKEDAIKFCKYYKAEKENPYHQSPSYYIWIVERMWVNDYKFLSIFVSRTTLGNVVPMRIRTDSSGNTSLKERISVK